MYIVFTTLMELFIYFPPLKYIKKILRHARKSFTATLTGNEAVQQNKKKRNRKSTTLTE